MSELLSVIDDAAAVDAHHLPGSFALTRMEELIEARDRLDA
jgi:hypothetical protein